MNTQEDKPLNIYQKLLKVQQHVRGLKKDKKAFGYDYVTGDKVLGVIMPLMNEVGLLLKQEVLSIDNTRQDYQTKNGTTSEINSKVMMRFTWVDTDTGQTDENLFGANGQNAWDKGVGSALTYGERYFLLKFFHIATDEDDIDNPARKPQEAQKAPEKAKGPEQTYAPEPATEAQKSEIRQILKHEAITKAEREAMSKVIDQISKVSAEGKIKKMKAAIEDRTGKPYGLVPVKQEDPATQGQREHILKLTQSHHFTEGEKEEAQMKCESAFFTFADAGEYIELLHTLIKEREAREKSLKVVA